MLFDDKIHPYVPLGWGRLHPKLHKIAKKAAKRGAVELKQDLEGNWYWRRLVDHPQMTLGL